MFGIRVIFSHSETRPTQETSRKLAAHIRADEEITIRLLAKPNALAPSADVKTM